MATFSWFSFRRLAALTAGALLWAAVPSAQAAVPATLGVQGAIYANAGGVAPDGTYDLTFAVYKDEAGGQALWTEGPVQVSVQGGVFAYALGSKTPVDPAVLATAKYVGIAVGQDPELPRKPLLAVAFAMRAGVAEALDCSGCVAGTALKTSSITSDKVGFAYAGADSKGGSALKALDLQCTGCVSVAEMNFDADVDLKDKSIKGNSATFAGTVTGKEFVGDGSKLTGIAQPKGKCAAGKAVIGISPDGELLCGSAVDTTALPPDGLNEVSNDLLSNQFVDVIASTKVSPIPDNNPLGVEDTIDMPDIGVAQKLTVSIDVANSNIGEVLVTLKDPAGEEYVLYSKTLTGGSLVTTFPDPTPPVAGDLTTWVGKNPKGKWTIKVVDSAYKDNKTDGQINKWSINLQTMSSKKVQVKGNLIVDGVISGKVTGLNYKSVRAKGGQTYCAGSYQNVSGLTFQLVTNGGPVRITGDVPVQYGSHTALRAVVDGKYAGEFSGMPWAYTWQEGLHCTSCGGCGNWSHLHYDRIFTGIPAGNHTFQLQIYTDGACGTCGIVVGNGSMDGFFAVQEL